MPSLLVSLVLRQFMSDTCDSKLSRDSCRLCVPDSSWKGQFSSLKIVEVSVAQGWCPCASAYLHSAKDSAKLIEPDPNLCGHLGMGVEKEAHPIYGLKEVSISGVGLILKC